MLCAVCSRTMTPLLYGVACDWCDGLVPREEFRGFIVWRDRDLPSLEYVFPSIDDAAKWRDNQGIANAPIREVSSFLPFQWRMSTGSIRDLMFADGLYEIHSDTKYPPESRRAHFATC